MTNETQFEVQHVQVDGHDVVCYCAGDHDKTVLCLNGGPGLPCNYLRDAHQFLDGEGFRVVCFDQLGCGASSRPDNTDLWNIDRYVEEVEQVRQQLGLGKVYLLGHSWGGWLAVEYMCRYAQHANALILANTCANIPHLTDELMRLRGALGSQTQAMMLAHEADGTFDHPEYEAAITLLNYRHVCRLPDTPSPVRYSMDNKNTAIYGKMQGPNEFLYTGNLRDWDRWAELADIRCPVLITVGWHDEITPACARAMHDRLPDSRVAVFRNSSHMPFYEQPQAYRERLVDFLKSSV